MITVRKSWCFFGVIALCGVAAAVYGESFPDTLLVKEKPIRLYDSTGAVLSARAQPQDRFLVLGETAERFRIALPSGNPALITKDTRYVAVLPGAEKPEPPQPPLPIEERPDPEIRKAKILLAVVGAGMLLIVFLLWRMLRTDKHLFDEPKPPKVR